MENKLLHPLLKNRKVSEVFMEYVEPFLNALLLDRAQKGIYDAPNIQELENVLRMPWGIWNAIIAGALPAHGNNGLISLIHSHQATSTLANLLTYTVQNPMISGLFNAFTSICMLTAFLGVSLSLMSFLSDGLKFQQSGKEGMTLFVLTFLPPLLMVIWFPGAYLFALNYAGYLCVVLLLILPALMVCYGRKHFHKKQHRNLPHWAPYIVIICSLALTLMTL